MLKRSKILVLLTLTLLGACGKKNADATPAGVNSNLNPNCPSIDSEMRFSGTNIVMTATSIYGGSVPNYNNFGYGTISMSTSQTFGNGVKLTNSNGDAGTFTLEVASGTGSNQYGQGNTGYGNNGYYNNYAGNGQFQYVNFSGSLNLSDKYRGHIREYLRRTAYNNYSQGGYSGNYYGNNNSYNNNYYGNNNNNYGNNYGNNNVGYPQNPVDINAACVSGIAINMGYSKDVNTGQPRELRGGQIVLYLNNSQTLYYTIPF